MTDVRDDIRVAIGIADSVHASANVTAPGAGAAIASIGAGSLPAGIYEVRVRCLQGPAATIAAGDIGNFKILKGAGNLIGVVQTGQEVIIPRVTLDGATLLSVNAGSAGTASLVYSASISATRVE